MNDGFTPTEFIAVVNQTLEYAYAPVIVTGEVASFKVNQGKWVFFDIKDEESSISCFMTLWNLRMPIEDGMKVAVKGVPKLTKWGKFSFTVETITPVGEGSLKKAYEMLRKKLTKEGLFDVGRKRPIPENLTELGVISSTGAAGYADFIKIINARWGGIRVQVANTQVQGIDAPDQIIRALKYFNEKSEVQMIAILRGGGSADDLSCFNDEKLVREIAASKIPVITGIGHEIDESLADLAADVRASTPSNAAEMLTRDRAEESKKIERLVAGAEQAIIQEVKRAERHNTEIIISARDRIMEMVERAEIKNGEQLRRGLGLLKGKYIEPMLQLNEEKIKRCFDKIEADYVRCADFVVNKMKILEALNPERVLGWGYAILSGKISPGEMIEIITAKQKISAEVKTIMERK